MKFIMRLNLMRTNCLKLIPLCVCAAAKKEGGLDALGEGLKSIYIIMAASDLCGYKKHSTVYYYGRYTGNLSAPAVKKGCE